MWWLVGCVVATLAHAVASLLWLPEPAPDPDAEPKLAYRALLTWPRIAVLGLVASLAASTLLIVPVPVRPVWFVYCSAVLVAVWIDLQTTYLPKLLHWVCLAELLIALAWVRPGFDAAARVAIAGLTTAALFWVVWRSSGTFGFGDVRLGLIVGGVPALWGWAHWYQALFLGVLIGAIWAVAAALRARRRDAVFPYGPALWLGPVLMAVIAAAS